MIEGPFTKPNNVFRWLWLASFVGFFALAFFLALEAAEADLNDRFATPPESPVLKPAVEKPSDATPAPNAPDKAESGQPRAVIEPITGSKGFMAEVTAFSSFECRTSWCQANAGKPRGRQVALNPRFGRPSKVYVPAFEKTYDVIGTTDSNTDLDIWFGDDHDTAKAFGRKTLLINLLP
jgi:hypothetical protein